MEEILAVIVYGDTFVSNKLTADHIERCKLAVQEVLKSEAETKYIVFNGQKEDVSGNTLAGTAADLTCQLLFQEGACAEIVLEQNSATLEGYLSQCEAYFERGNVVPGKVVFIGKRGQKRKVSIALEKLLILGDTKFVFIESTEKTPVYKKLFDQSLIRLKTIISQKRLSAT